MPAQWLNSSSSMAGRVVGVLTGMLQSMSQPENTRRIRQVLMILFALWAVLALARLVWALVPVNEAALDAAPKAINPITSNSVSSGSNAADITRMRGWHLFGKAGAQNKPVVVAEPVQETDNTREGIEDGARETSLKVKLRGIVASSEDGLGHAIMEYQSKQAIYAVEDKLPMGGGKVFLAKVMPRQVVLDNRGTYELLKLFDDAPLAKSTRKPGKRATKPKAAASKEALEQRGGAEAAAVAKGLRESLYKNPQSLAKLVRVGAVRKDGALLGYRVTPGQQSEQFAALGFKSGDMVTAVNGIKLDNPANTMVLYNAMRAAQEVVFELERDGQPVNISVDLNAQAAGGSESRPKGH